MFADVIIPLAVAGIYTYSVPDDMISSLTEGVLVVVSFGRNKKYTGVVVKIHHSEPQGYKTKPIEEIAENSVRFSSTHLRFLLWISEYYMATPGEVFRAALPVVFRLESHTSITLSASDIDFSGLSKNEDTVIRFLLPGQDVTLKDIEKLLNIKNGLVVLKSLLNKGYIQIKETVDDDFRDKKETVVKLYKAFAEPELNKILDKLKKAPAQHTMLCNWIELQQEEMTRPDFLKTCGNSPSALKALCDKNIFTLEERIISRLNAETLEIGAPYPLSDIQQTAYEEINNKFETYNSVLFKGVTSSGKTEVYIHLIKKYIDEGKQVLYMLPEIALTVQIVRRLKRVFGNQIGIYHSGMPDTMRAELWKKQCSSDPYPLILGVRSSVFLPFSHLGLIIVDEEHDASYKQKDPSPRYHGRDSVIMAAKFYGAKVLLGSATPSFESYENALSGKYGLVELNQRHGDVMMPELMIADVAECRRKKLMKGSFTPLLYETMKKVLEEGNQVILFQNRRGYSTYLQCDECGSVLKCKHCDVSMTYYKNRDLTSCRYCGSIRKPFELCEDCGKGHYKFRTPGTERIEEEVLKLFPEIRVGRMDTEIMNSKSKYNAVIRDFEQGKINVLIGTQMVSKGLDFDHVKLVGVMDADNILNFPDFRSEERAYCMLMQVSGRSGRKKERGKVIIQTSDKENRVYSMLTSGDYEGFYTQFSEERQLFGYPPFYRIIQLELRHTNNSVVRKASNTLILKLRNIFGRRIFGPTVPEISMINKQYRIQILLKIEQGASFSKAKQLLRKELNVLQEQKEFGALRIVCDVDVY
ncbi:primosomal protein N' [Odoribacter sp. OttesenSCG-928-J03]|nr:primosomal protein N' [Odoribacter sp. OttesenSCG-928-J03]